MSGLSLEDLMNVKVETVIGASKREQKETTAAASVTIITADDIRKFGYRTLADILSNVPGFYITYDRNYSYAAVQGFGPEGDYNSRILLLIDGHRLNDNIFDQALLGTEFPLDLDVIDRVEIIQGPGSSMYGSSAFFGVINVVTKKAGSLKGAEASISAGSLLTGYARVSGGGVTKSDLGAFASASIYNSRGNDSLFFPNSALPRRTMDSPTTRITTVPSNSSRTSPTETFSCSSRMVAERSKFPPRHSPQFSTAPWKAHGTGTDTLI